MIEPNDRVRITAGRHRGRTGRVSEFYVPNPDGKIIVELDRNGEEPDYFVQQNGRMFALLDLHVDRLEVIMQIPAPPPRADARGQFQLF